MLRVLGAGWAVAAMGMSLLVISACGGDKGDSGRGGSAPASTEAGPTSADTSTTEGEGGSVTCGDEELEECISCCEGEFPTEDQLADFYFARECGCPTSSLNEGGVPCIDECTDYCVEEGGTPDLACKLCVRNEVAGNLHTCGVTGAWACRDDPTCTPFYDCLNTCEGYFGHIPFWP
ncbi:MAG: hypothetical protein ACI9K2_004282 [Myxococcota bacterium]|jgi:hypothetical protein